MAIELATGYVTILPSTRGLGKAIVADLNSSSVQSQVASAGQAQGSKFRSSFGKALAVGGGIGAALFSGKALTAGFDRLTTIQDATKSLTVQLGDAGKAGKLVEDITKTVQGTPFALNQFVDVGQNLTAFGVSAEKIPKFLTAIGDAAATKGKQAPEIIDRLSLSLGQAAADGRIMSDTIRELTQAGVPAAQILADKLGIDSTDVRLLAAKGKLVGPEYLDAILEGIQEKQGGLAKGLGKTLSGSLANAKISFARAGANVIAPFTSQLTSAFQGTGATVDALGKKMAEFATTAAPKVSAAFGALKTVSIALYENGIKPTFDLVNNNREVFATLAAGLVAYKVATLGVALALKVQAIAFRVAAFATLGFNAALRANPIGAVITILTLLAAGLVLAHQRSSTFRSILTATWAAIKTGVGAMWSVVQPILSRFRDFLGVVLPPVIKVLGTVFRVYFAIISTYIKVWWTVVSRILSLFVGYLQVTVFPVIRFLYNNVVKPMFEAMGAVIGYVWRDKIKPVFSLMAAGVGVVRDAIGRAVSSIRTVWNGIKEAFRGPVEWVLKNVVNPLIDAIDGVAQKLTGKKLIGKNFSLGGAADTRPSGGNASGAGRNGGFYAGGWTGPGSKMTPAGVVHADEFVVRKDSRKRIEKASPGLLDYMNRTGRTGYAKGGRVKPLAGGTPSTYAGHTGVDFNAPNDYGKPIQAADNGVVSLVKHLKTSYGNYVMVKHAKGVQTLYAHMSKTLARVGQTVTAGQTIGRVGSTGNSSGPHLHFEVRPGGTYSSALNFLKGATTMGATGADGGTNPVSEIKAVLSKIKTNVSAYGAKSEGLARLVSDGTLGTMGKQALAWARKQASKVADFVSPAFAAGKWLKGKLGKGGVKGAAKNALGDYGWGAGEFSPLNKLWERESGWNPRADNPKSSAYGIPQALPGSKMRSAGADWKTNPLTQVKWGLGYIKDRYGTPSKAWAHSQRTGWYADGGRVHQGVYDRGGVVNPGTTVVSNKSRKPEALLTSTQWKMLKDNLVDLPKGQKFPGAKATFNLLSDEQWAQVAKVLPSTSQTDKTNSVLATGLKSLAGQVGKGAPLYKGLSTLAVKFRESSSALAKNVALVGTLSTALAALKESAAAVVSAVTEKFSTDVFGITEGNSYADGTKQSLLGSVMQQLEADTFTSQAFGRNLASATSKGLTKPLLEQLALSGNTALAEALAQSTSGQVKEFVSLSGQREKAVATVANKASGAVFGERISAAQSQLAGAQGAAIKYAAETNAYAATTVDVLKRVETLLKSAPAATGREVTASLKTTATKGQQRANTTVRRL